jgi:TRAP-type C4-dicarboxylate transport system substrate-binding protein
MKKRWAVRTRLSTAVLVSAALILAGCADADEVDDAQAAADQDSDTGTPDTDDGDNTEETRGVPVGASMEEYQAAFEGMDPIEIQYQITTTPDHPLTRGLSTEYVAAVEEWSGGKITFDVVYASGAVPFDQASDGVQQGLLDAIIHAPVYEPDRFPAYNLGVDLTMIAENTPVFGQMQAFASFIEFGFEQEDIAAELADNNAFPLMPYAEQNGAALLCVDDPVESLDDFDGKQIRATSVTHTDELEALGATPVSMPMTEIFEAFQRGIIDCSTITLTTAGAIGVHEIGDSWTLDPEVTFTSTPSTTSFNIDAWEALPLEAQQLLWDKMVVMLEYNFWGYIESDRAVLEESTEEYGLTVHQWEPEVRDVFHDYYETWVDDTPDRAPQGVDGEAFAQLLVDLHDKYHDILEELGYRDVDISWPELPDLDIEEIDFRPFAERVWEEVYLPRRPG